MSLKILRVSGNLVIFEINKHSKYEVVYIRCKTMNLFKEALMNIASFIFNKGGNQHEGKHKQ